MFNRLAPPLQRALWELGWQALRDNQVAALPLILDTQDDVVVSAATAAGKTEAAFLPLLTRLWQGQPVPSKTEASVATAGAGPKGLILYVAPVKALHTSGSSRVRHQTNCLVAKTFMILKNGIGCCLRLCFCQAMPVVHGCWQKHTLCASAYIDQTQNRSSSSQTVFYA